MTSKRPEEGKVWEWRSFGAINEDLEKKIRSYPIRLGIVDHPEEDIYLISPLNDQNVKIRREAGEWVLKLKRLVEVGAHGIELYSETAQQVYRFPIGEAILAETASLLQTAVQKVPSSGLSMEDLLRVCSSFSPPINIVKVTKRRSQFEFPGGWIEVATAEFPSANVSSLSVHSPDRKKVSQMVARLKPRDGLEVMNYVKACRKWQ